jgi:hypothetical protein
MCKDKWNISCCSELPVSLFQCLVAELNMYEAQASAYKSDLTRANEELQSVKKKYFAQVNLVFIMFYR